MEVKSKIQQLFPSSTVKNDKIPANTLTQSSSAANISKRTENPGRYTFYQTNPNPRYPSYLQNGDG